MAKSHDTLAQRLSLILTKLNNGESFTVIELANEFPEIVKIVAVGNESMVHWAESYFVAPKIIQWCRSRILAMQKSYSACNILNSLFVYVLCVFCVLCVLCLLGTLHEIFLLHFHPTCCLWVYKLSFFKKTKHCSSVSEIERPRITEFRFSNC